MKKTFNKMGQNQSTRARAWFPGDCGSAIKGYVGFWDGICEIKLSGLKPKQKHALHIHEYGDKSGGCKTCGGHYNPKGVNHGSYLYPGPYHVGDLINNVESNRHGRVSIRFVTADDLKIDDILGRSIVIHDLADDLGRQGIKIDRKFVLYKDMDLELLKKIAFSRNYYKRGDRASKKEIIKKLDNESLTTGNAGGRMACAVIGRIK